LTGGVANLVERREGSDPIDRFDPGEFRAGAFIPYRSRAATLRIDGAYDTTWDTAQFQGNDGIDLFIHNRMVGNDPMRSDGNTEYRWAAMHDGRYLYLFVVGAEGDIHTPWGDSLEPWMDDAIDIFLDGNRSRGDTYDGVDDYHIIIPLLKLNQGEGASNRSIDTSGTADPSGRFSVGFNSLPVPPNAIDFATCAVCPIADAYEIRLDMQAFGIPVNAILSLVGHIHQQHRGLQLLMKPGVTHR